jgi:hypothetical protein
LKTLAKVLVEDDDVTIRENDRDVCIVIFLSDDDENTRIVPRNRPSLLGNRFTSWNLFAWIMSVSGNVAKRACLKKKRAIP